MKTRLTFWTGVGSVTGANFLADGGEGRILVDCGLTQGIEDEFAVNSRPFGYDPSTADALLVTHAHIDHIGRIPKLVHDGFKGDIYSHPATRDLAEVMLQDALRLMETEASERGAKPFYGRHDVESALGRWKTVEYGERRDVCGFSVTPKDAGHILGSAMYELERGGKRLVFTGDLGNSPSLLLRDTEPVTGATYMVMESVYGDRNHEGRGERSERLREIVADTIARGGTLIIPAFSLERTQMIIYELNNLVEDGHVPSVPVYVDSPLATKVTEIYRSYPHLFNDTVRREMEAGDDIFAFPKLSFTLSREDSEAIEKKGDPKIVIAGSGMSGGGRVLGHEARHLGDPKSTVLLVGYQTLGTLGRRLQDGAKKVHIAGREIKVRARIEMIQSYSSHKDSDGLVEFAATGRETLEKVFVAMGEPKASLYLAQKLRDYEDIEAIYPEQGKEYELEI